MRDLHRASLLDAWNPTPGQPWTPPEDPPPSDPPTDPPTDPTYFDEHGVLDLGVLRAIE